jgi:hypothetical protein
VLDFIHVVLDFLVFFIDELFFHLYPLLNYQALSCYKTQHIIKISLNN